MYLIQGSEAQETETSGQKGKKEKVLGRPKNMGGSKIIITMIIIHRTLGAQRKNHLQ